MARYTIELTPMEMERIESTLSLAADKAEMWSTSTSCVNSTQAYWKRDADELREIAKKFKQAKPTRD